MKPRVALALFAASCAAALPAAAQTLYKLIDKNGKVTYSESPPKDFKGQVIRMDIDPKANTATLPRPSAAPAPAKSSAPAAASGRDSVEAARGRLEAARKALQEAIDNPRDDEIRRVGNKGGGTRPVPTDEYEKRLEGLRESVRKAEEDLRVAEGR